MNLPLSTEQFAAEGVALVRGLVPESLLGIINGVMRAQAARVMAALGNRPIGIGSRNGYHELVQRSPGRFDVPMHEQDLVPIWGAQGSMAADVPWLGLVGAVLGPDARPSFCGVVFSRPRSPAQQWHIDSPHEAAAFDSTVFLSCIPLPPSFCLNISATQGDGIEELKEAIFRSCLKGWREEREGVTVTNLRHKVAIENAALSLARAIQELTDNQPIEIIALELRDSLDHLGEIVGAVTTDDVLEKIFTEFCIGK